MAPPLHVVAAVIERDGRILICQRVATGRHPLKWEFPGGKLEAGETPEQGLARELREELAIDAAIGEPLDRYTFRYPQAERETHLWFFRVTEFAGEPRNLEFEQIVWEHPAALGRYDFLEGDVAFVARLIAAATSEQS
jgi:8-oxo-dGTP diphosphatase